jgi:predicted O-linked N-acetylglucosamine transferase (SPINDLY family)
MTRATIEQAHQIALDHYRAGRLADAEAVYRQVLALGGDDAGVLSNLGIVLQGSGRLDEAIAAYRRAITLRGDHGAAWSNLGSALSALGRLDEAITALDRALAIDPGHAQAHANRGVALHASGRLEEAIAALRRAIALAPRDAVAHTNLGRALHDAGQPDEAEDVLLRAVAIDPGQGHAHNNLGSVQKDQGRVDLALESFGRALECDPGHVAAASNRLFALHLHPDHDAASIATECRRWASRFAAPLAAEIRPHANDRTPGRRLRVGFVSPDLRSHPVGRLLLPLFLHRDRRGFELIAYSDVRAGDAVTREFQALADEWRPIAGRSDAEVAALVRADRIDVLVDLAQHTAANRLLVFARRPAPVQVSMLGMPTTTGLATIDYRLTDRYLDPPGLDETVYTERSIRLAHGFWCYPPLPGAPAVGELPALSSGTITFGCLNQSAKLSRPVLEFWIKLLGSLSGSRLLLQASSARQRAAILALFAAGGIAPERAVFVPRVPLVRYLEWYHEIDIGLDPFPYGGGTTTMDALWMGVPVVTLTGRTAVGRGGESILQNLAMPELVARTPEEYAEIARELAVDHGRLAALRRSLRTRMEASPLVDTRQYTAEVEGVLRGVWEAWCRS